MQTDYQHLRTDRSLHWQCVDFLFNYQYGHLKACPKCEYPVNGCRINNRVVYCFCTNPNAYCPNAQVSPMSTTIFRKSEIPLPIWFEAIYLWDSSYNITYRALPKHWRIPSTHIQELFGVTYKTAWRMRHQIAKLYQEDRPMYDAILEWWTRKRSNL